MQYKTEHACSEMKMHACMEVHYARHCRKLPYGKQYRLMAEMKLYCHLLLPLGLQVRYLLLPEVSWAGVHFHHAPLHVRVLNLHHTLQLVQ
jgi:hypothetical protein